MQGTEKKRVLVAMSGGVDSSVAAALLKEQGYEVAVATMQIWPDAKCDAGARGCCSLAAVEDARYVAYRLDIPYHVFNFKDVFQKSVIGPFIAEYLRGRTPNPCVLCNRVVKFEALLERARALHFDCIATGHYGVVEYDGPRGRWLLKKSRAGKDQSYALYNLSQEALSRLLLPIAHMEKPDVRKKAAALGLDVADKPDSQEICFVEDNDYAAFIEREGYSAPPGNFVDPAGNILGRHKGIIHYTVGQRKGLGMTFGEPKFVTAVRADTNEVVLGSDEECFADSLYASDLNFISIPALERGMRVGAKIRYSQREAPALLRPAGHGRARVIFDEPQRAVTPGQSVVFYDGDVVVGGGVIE